MNMWPSNKVILTLHFQPVGARARAREYRTGRY